MTTIQAPDPRFAWIKEHGGPVVDWEDPSSSHRHAVTAVGLDGWFTSDHLSGDRPAKLDKHIKGEKGLLMLGVGLSHDQARPVHWSSVLKVTDQRYVRVSGTAQDFPSALAAAETHEHESRQFGGLTWWHEGGDCWVSWLGSFDLRATKISGHGEQEPYWLFERQGRAHTLEEAALLAALGGVTGGGE
ncbi:MAG: hypothetical protein PHI49_13035 [Halothiobacillaceae bacterium]|nr:hypothetical protein [Halothiobacillaceae bacterium]